MSAKLNCPSCGVSFSVDQTEQAYLERISPKFGDHLELVGLPSLCAGCREQNRVAFRNEFNFYKRQCALSGKEIVSIYSPSSPYTVYEPSLWWSDEYEPTKYGRDCDFSRSFFEQFHELNLAVPKAAIQNAKSENSLYTNYSAENKNCYICAGSSFNEDCYYCSRVISSKLVCDSYDLLKCESCYGCLHSTFLYGSAFAKNCHNSSALILCENCIGCKDCLGCVDLRNQQFCIFNQQYSESEYKQKYLSVMEELARSEFAPRIKSERQEYIVGCESCSGNHLVNCANCISCFSLKESQDCRYVGLATNSKDCFDCNFMDRCELVYCSTNLIGNYRVLFSALVWFSNECLYAMNCFNSNSLFGCTGMKRNEFCILNQQYSKAAYMELVPKIIEHMRETGEWGAYFPMKISPFPYNATVAQSYYPLTREQALSQELPWEDEALERKQESRAADVFVCKVSGKSFRIIAQEKELCERLGIPLPTKCPEVRRKEMTDKIVRAIANFV